MFPPFFTETMKARERMKKCKWVKIGCLVLLSAVFIGFVIYFNTTLHFPKPGDAEIGITYAKARVVSIDQEDIGPDPDFNYIRIGKQWLTLEILSGDQKGHTTTAINYIERVNNRPAVVGTNMIISSYDGFITTMIVNYNREASIYMIAALFFAAVLLIGRKKAAQIHCRTVIYFDGRVLFVHSDDSSRGGAYYSCYHCCYPFCGCLTDSTKWFV